MAIHLRSLRAAASRILLVILVSQGMGAESLSAPLHIEVSSLKTASAPRLWDDYAIFTAGFEARSVGIAFSLEDFGVVHQMDRNRHGIFFLVLPLPPGSDDPIRYRLVVDGAWIRDPSNPDSERDPATGMALSVFRYPRISDEKPGVYRILKDRKASFAFRTLPGRKVYLAGTFNDWDPFMYPMAETEPGRYELSLVLSSGIQRYAFVVDGELLTDPLNPESAYSRDGLRVSVLSVP